MYVESFAELETQILIAKELYKDVDFSKAEAFLAEAQKMLTTIIKKLQ